MCLVLVYFGKIVNKCPALVDPSHSTSGSLLVHMGHIDGHMRCPIIQFFIKIEFRKTCGHIDGRKKVTSKDPFLVYARRSESNYWQKYFPFLFCTSGKHRASQTFDKNHLSFICETKQIKERFLSTVTIGDHPKTYSYISVYLEIFYHLPNISVKQMQTHSYRLNLSDFVDI